VLSAFQAVISKVAFFTFSLRVGEVSSNAIITEVLLVSIFLKDTEANRLFLKRNVTAGNLGLALGLIRSEHQ